MILKTLLKLADQLDLLNIPEKADEVDQLAETYEQFSKPILKATQIEPNAMYIDWLNIPEDQRGKGLGKKTYYDWENSLPTTIKKVYLHAGDLGTGATKPFWESVGFKLVDKDEDKPFDHYMVKVL